MKKNPKNNVNRRHFLKSSGKVAAASAVLSQLPVERVAHAAVGDTVSVALVGCGGRGSGAVSQIRNTKGNTKLLAVADVDPKKAKSRVAGFKKQFGDWVDVPEDRIFGGLDGYKSAIDSGADLVVIATPPGFKPQQFEYAVKAGKHIFCEKPVASDAPGVRRVLAATQEAKKKNLMVGIGLQRRHEERYIDNVKRLHDGAIGEINLMRVYWNGRGIWYRNRTPEQTEMAFQCNNWYHFIWASGDQICEQHIHNLDVGNWVMQDYPIMANGMGGGEMRMGGDRTKSQIFDHTFVEYTYANGHKMYSQGRHLGGNATFGHVAEYAHGSKGTCKLASVINQVGKDPLPIRGKGGGHQQEQTDLIEALGKGEIYNEGEYGAKATFTAILGREACYSGRQLKWDDLLNKGRDYCPGIDNWTLKTDPPAMKGADGKYPAPQPGIWNPFA
ncbi:MAG: Gfo/Idh/MocA family oxidoreductase [Verrucomicrobiota bacterium]|nr:Gfo/Idh/MocA family oxidoreductase [Verrucomicrobiota bacterium]